MRETMIRHLEERWAEVGHQKTAKELKFEIEFYKKMLQIFQVGPSFFMIFNPTQSIIEYISPALETILGYSPEEYDIRTLLEAIHPDDVPYFIDFEDAVVDFKLSLPPEKIMKYKSRYDYRIRHKNGHYIRILQQSVTIETEPDGAILRNFVVCTDISRWKLHKNMTLSFIGLDGEPAFRDVRTQRKYLQVNDTYTKREKEIILLLSKSYSSSRIASKLNISIETVKTHRRNIHRKSGTSNTVELVISAIENGWI